MSEPSINGGRLLGRLETFARIGATPGGGVNRQALSAEDRAARRLLAEIGLSRGFALFQDEMANLFLRRAGANDDLPPLLIGSHLDSQPTGGRFDGALGTLAALEVLEALEDSGTTTDRPVELVAWTNEEGSRFSPGTMGSLAFRDSGIAQSWRDQRGTDDLRLDDELQATLAALPEAPVRNLGHPISGFIELHIEQGPTLEKEGLAIGVVEGVQGTRWIEVAISGQAAHAGTTELAYRRDPMAAATGAATELLSSVMLRDPMSRLTVGRFSATPGSVNSIPAEVVFTVDIRHPVLDQLQKLETLVGQTCIEMARTHGCTARFKRLLDMEPARFDQSMVRILDQAASGVGLSSKRMISGAFHDALNLSAVAPTAMIFVPCRDGLSHNEAEFVEPGHAINGARVLFEAVIALARSSSASTGDCLPRPAKT